MVVLMCLVGHDYQRIIDGVNYWRLKEPIEAIYLIYDKKRDPFGYASRRNVKDLEKVLSFADMKPKILGIDPQSYEEVFTSIYKVLKLEVLDNRRKVLIDVTSTTKEAYGAILIASLMFPNVQVYVVPPEDRGWYLPEPGTPEYDEWFNKVRMRKGSKPQQIYLPGNRLQHPSYDEMRILVALIEHGGRADSVKSIIKWCGENPRNPAVKNRYSRLISKLLSRGLVKEEVSTKTKRITLTGFGKILAKSLRNISKSQGIVTDDFYFRREEMVEASPKHIFSRDQIDVAAARNISSAKKLRRSEVYNLANMGANKNSNLAQLAKKLENLAKL